MKEQRFSYLLPSLFGFPVSVEWDLLLGRPHPLKKKILEPAKQKQETYYKSQNDNQARVFIASKMREKASHYNPPTNLVFLVIPRELSTITKRKQKEALSTKKSSVIEKPK